MSKPKPKNFIIPLHVYPFSIMVSIDQSDEELKKRLNGLDIDPSFYEALCRENRTVNGLCVESDGNICIRLKTLDDKVLFIGNIVHESFHATSFIMNKIGSNNDEFGGSEPFAYLLQYIAQEIIKQIGAK